MTVTSLAGRASNIVSLLSLVLPNLNPSLPLFIICKGVSLAYIRIYYACSRLLAPRIVQAVSGILFGPVAIACADSNGGVTCRATIPLLRLAGEHFLGCLPRGCLLFGEELRGNT